VTDRAVSDVVGFTLMFSIIILSVAIVSTAGLTQLSELSERESINSGERAMEAFAGSVDDLSRQGDLVREATLSPGGGTIWLNGDAELGIEVTDGAVTHLDQTYAINALEHRYDRNPEDVTISYEGGGVFRSDGAAALVRPQWRCTSDRAVLTVVKFAGTSSFSVGDGYGSDSGDPLPPGGEGVPSGTIESTDRGVRFQLTRVDADTYAIVDETAPSGTLDVSVDYANAANPEQWEFFLDRSQGWTDTGECADVEMAVVRVVTVEIAT